MDWTIFGTALAAVAVLFAWGEYRLRKMPSTREAFFRLRTVVYLLTAGVLLICGASVVFAMKSGVLALETMRYLAGGMLFLGCLFLAVVFVRVFWEGLNLFKTPKVGEASRELR